MGTIIKDKYDHINQNH